jgi:hypothetical protein
LVVSGLQCASGVGLRAQSLDSIHDVHLLRQESIPDLLHPAQPVVHYLENLRERYQRLHACVPVLLFEGCREFIAAELRIVRVADPTVGFDHFKGVGRGHENLCQ